jgi:hypothetical protein
MEKNLKEMWGYNKSAAHSTDENGKGTMKGSRSDEQRKDGKMGSATKTDKKNICRFF